MHRSTNQYIIRSPTLPDSEAVQTLDSPPQDLGVSDTGDELSQQATATQQHVMVLKQHIGTFLIFATYQTYQVSTKNVIQVYFCNLSDIPSVNQKCYTSMFLQLIRHTKCQPKILYKYIFATYQTYQVSTKNVIQVYFCNLSDIPSVNQKCYTSIFLQLIRHTKSQPKMLYKYVF